MVAILVKGEFNTDFHPMVDFIAASPLRIETMDEGIHILATVDGIQRTVSESSLRRNLKLRDENGIVSIPDTELFENLTLMGAWIAQSSALPTVADEPASPMRDGMSINEGEAAAERISNDSEEIARVLTSIDAATVLAGGIDIPTGSGFIPTAGPPATEVMVESETLKKKKSQEQIDAQVARELEKQQEKENMRMNEQIARDVEVAR
nr:hypothetical protein [Tanacetum cinerariifolium]